MFKEIAVDPAAVATSYRDFSYIIEKFGIPEGRLIAAFPSKWKRYVYQAAEARLKGSVDLSRIQERLRRMSDAVLIRRDRPGDGCDHDWLQAAVNEHLRLPFDIIIAGQQRDELFVVAASDLDGEHPAMQPNRQWHINRIAGDMAACCAPLLSSANHIKLVDPHFDVGVPRFRRPFLEFLKLAPAGATIDIFRGDDKDAGHVANGIVACLPNGWLTGRHLRLFIRPSETLHNRFVLTESGGVYFMTGLDDQGNHGLETDEVGILEHAVWQVQWGRYSGADPIAVWP